MLLFNTKETNELSNDSITQAVYYESIDKIVLDYYLKTYHKETQ